MGRDGRSSAKAQEEEGAIEGENRDRRVATLVLSILRVRVKEKSSRRRRAADGGTARPREVAFRAFKDKKKEGKIP